MIFERKYAEHILKSTVKLQALFICHRQRSWRKKVYSVKVESEVPVTRKTTSRITPSRNAAGVITQCRTHPCEREDEEKEEEAERRRREN